MEREREELRSAREHWSRNPSDLGLHQDFVLALSAAGEHREAIEQALELARLVPREVSAWSTLGRVMKRARNWEGAEMAYRRSLLLRPRDPQVMSLLGLVLKERGELEQALGFFQASLEADELQGSVWSSYGNALLAFGAFDDAVVAQCRAVELEPQKASLWANLSNGYRQAGRLEMAMAAIEEGLKLDPELPGLHWNRALIQLCRGDLRTGFEGYEWRYRRPGMSRPDWLDRAWSGEPLPGRVLELHTEQGFGDALQFARFVRAAAERVGEVVLRAHPRMVSILEGTPGVGRVLARGGPESGACAHHYLMSIPSLLELDSVDPSPYLRASPQRVEAWSRRCRALDAGGERFKIGICWQGNPRFEADALRSPPLAELAPLAQVQGVRLISLQKHHGLDQLADWRRPLEIVDLASELDTGDQAFVDTAAVMRSLDLVVTSDTAIAHLAGALGVEVWVALNSSPDWRWGLHGRASMWYESMRLFRQPEAGAWGRVYAQMADELVARLGRQR